MSIEPLHVTFVLPGYPRRPMGGFRVVYEYANHLVARGHRVTVVHARRCVVPPGTDTKAVFTPDRLRRGFEFVRETLGGPRIDWHRVDPRVDLQYVGVLRASCIPIGDVVVATSWRTAEPVLACGPEKGHKFYLVQHHETWDGPEDAVNATWQFPMRKIVIARWLERVGRELGVPTAEMRYIPNGIDHGTYRITKPIPGRPKRVAALCHKAQWKGSREAVAALELTRAAVPELDAVMFGTAPRPDFVPSWIEYCQNPRQDELVNNIYNGSSIYLCASWAEGWHLPPAEAMACGTAVVSTAIDGVSDYAVPGRTALTGQPRDPQTLADPLIQLLRDEPRRVALAEAAVEKISEFTWEAATDAVEQWFSDPNRPPFVDR